MAGLAHLFGSAPRPLPPKLIQSTIPKPIAMPSPDDQAAQAARAAALAAQQKAGGRASTVLSTTPEGLTAPFNNTVLGA